MIRLPKCAAVLQAALVAAAALALCSAGRSQTPPTPTVTITSPASGLTFNTPYIVVQVMTANFSSVSGGTLTITPMAGPNVGVPYTLPLYGSVPSYSSTTSNPKLIASGQTFYDGPVTYVASITGYNTAYPPVQVTVGSATTTDTVQIGYILGALSLNAADVTAPTNGATVHLSPSSKTVTIASDHHADFYRYDDYATSYDPTFTCQLGTTFPNATGIRLVQHGSEGFQLPAQKGDVGTIYYLTDSETYTGSFANPFSFTFSNQALSFYPATTTISSAVTSATATYSGPQ